MHKIINHPLIKDKLTRMRKVSTVSTVCLLYTSPSPRD